MASKHRNPSPASSDEEDDSEQSDAEETLEQQQQQNGAVEEEGEGEDESGEEEEDEDDDDDEEKSSENKSTVAPAAGSGSETGSDSDSDDFPPSPNVSDFTIRPITSKPMKNSDNPSAAKPKKQKKSESKDSSGGGGDEEEEEDDDDDDNGVEESGKKGSGNQRLWNPDDEIAVLKGMVEYQSKNGAIMNSDMDDFREFINKSLHVKVSKSQLIHKIQRLKKKYQANAEKVENGEDPIFSKPYEGKSYELSNKVWGYNANGGSSAKNKRKTSSVDNVDSILALPIQDGAVKQPVVSNWGAKRERTEEVGSFGSSYPCLNEALESGKCFDLTAPVLLGVKETNGLIEGSKVKKWEKKWKKLRMDETELYLKKLELIVEQTKLTLKAMKAS